MRAAAAWVVIAGCAAPAADPRLASIDPALVSSLVETRAVVSGVELDALAHLDLGSTEATIDRGWRVRVVGTLLATTWRDRTQLDVVIPRGLVAGVHDVTAIAPDGRELLLPAALTITPEPVGLRLSIEDAPGGTGQPIGGVRVAGDQSDAFAVVRDPGGTYVIDVTVTWGTTGPFAHVMPSGAHATFEARTAGAGRLIARHAGAGLDAESGELTTVAAAPVRIMIADAPAFAGTVIGDRSGLTTDADGGFTAYAVAVDAFDNVTGDATATWTLDGVAGATPGSATTLAALDFATPGTGTLRATHATLGGTATGTLTVAPGRAASLAIEPATLATTADASPIQLAASGVDGDGNPTSNLGTLTWSISSGPITTIDPATGVLDPVRAGIGTIALASSWGATAATGAIVIAPGVAATVAIAPPVLAIAADQPPVTFTASLTDADANVVAGAPLTWSIVSGSITTIDPVTGIFDPQAAGSGMVAATTLGGATSAVPVTVIPGRAVALAITPGVLDVVAGAPGVPFAASGTDGDGNPTPDLGTLDWVIASGPIAEIDATTGMLTPIAAGIGAIRATSSYGPSGDSGEVRIRGAAALTAVLDVPAQVAIGQVFTVAMTTTNTGENAAAAITPCAVSLGGSGTAAITATPATVPLLAAGASMISTWSVTATAPGSVMLTTCASATDATTMAVLTAPASGATTVLRPAQLEASLVVPAFAGRGGTFTATMTVRNTGEVAATSVTPSALAATGSGAVTLAGSAPIPSSIAPGATAVFTWSFVAAALGSVQFHGTATGVDASSSAIVTSPIADSGLIEIVDAHLAAFDPFGDSTAFGFVTGYAGQIYLGPSASGTAAVRMASPAATPEPLTFLFARDTTGSGFRNTSTAPYTSLGGEGCVPNTPACGPDNEDLRGQFASFAIGGTEWLIASGAKSARGAAYLYMTTDTNTNLDFRYVDMTSIVASGNTYGVSALGAVGSRLYVGLAGTGSQRAKLFGLTSMPPAPGLDATPAELVNMHLERLGSWTGSTDPENVDSIASIGGHAYVANARAWVRATTTSPAPVPALCPPATCTPDWTEITPAHAAYAARPSRITTKAGELEPADRAVVQIAAFGDRIFVARNTTSGPQLWSCRPEGSACDADDWNLVAANSTGDTLLTQFDDPSLTSVSMLVATASFLYVGFDSAAGVQVFRTANPAASTRAGFEGAGGCSAGQHPAACEGLGGAGLGAAGNTQVFDAKAITAGGATSVWMTIGDGSSPLSLVMIP